MANPTPFSFLIFCSVGVCSILCHNSSFGIFSDHLTFKVSRRHRFTNTGSDPTNSFFLIWSPGFLRSYSRSFLPFKTRIFKMMVMRACSWPKKRIVPYKRNKLGNTKATLKTFLLKRKTNHWLVFQFAGLRQRVNTQFWTVRVSTHSGRWLPLSHWINSRKLKRSVLSSDVWPPAERIWTSVYTKRRIATQSITTVHFANWERNTAEQ